MPNWCSTDITFYSANKEPIEKMRKMLTKLEENPSRVENDFGSLWLGNILDAHNIDWKKESCRGYITYFSQIEEKEEYWTIQVQQEDAWTPNHEMWYQVLDAETDYEGIELVYYAFEPGCPIYITSDSSGSFYPIRYRIEACLQKTDCNYPYHDYIEEEFSNEKDLLETLNELNVNHFFTSVQEANRYFNNFIRETADPDAYFALYECEICP